MPASIPTGVTPYKRTALFTKETTPKGLLSRHNTKVGTWGLIHVEKGSVTYTVFGEHTHDWDDVQVLTAGGQPGVIEPQVWHKVEPSDDAEFYVEFLGMDGDAVKPPGFVGAVQDSTGAAGKAPAPSVDRSLVLAAAVAAAAACLVLLVVGRRA